jgi:hypothetical protein
MRDECQHGSLRTKCEICERDAQIQTLQAAIRRAIYHLEGQEYLDAQHVLRRVLDPAP